MQKYTVAEFTKAFKDAVAVKFQGIVSITGEVSNLHKASSGHIYFSLKDADIQLKCAWFKQFAFANRNYTLKNGDNVEVIGEISIYEADSSYQILVKKVSYDSVGEFWQIYEKVKRKLEDEGLFDHERKKPIDFMPNCIALITSNQGAAIKDFCVTLQNAGVKLKVEVWNVTVQGVDAVKQICSAVNKAGKLAMRYDAIVLTRGGGSLEDLSVFNNEAICRAVASSKVPVISAIGHERDTTVVDFVSDYRASTPTASAMKLIELYQNKLGLFESTHDTLINNVVSKLQRFYQRLDYLSMKLETNSPKNQLFFCNNKLQLFEKSLKSMLDKKLNEVKLKLESFKYRLNDKNPQNKLSLLKLRVDNNEKKLYNLQQIKLTQYRNSLSEFETKLKLLNPENILDRGYAIIYKSGHVISSINDVNIKEDIEIKVKDGYIGGLVSGKKC